MGIYKKLQTVRANLSKLNLTKSGHNSYSHFDYFELGDFLPQISQLCNEIGICAVVTFDKDKGILTLYDDEDERTISIECETRELDLISKQGNEKMNKLQALGAEQTYIRRYLYMNMFEVCENDAIDSGDVESKEEPKPKQEIIEQAQDNYRERLITRIIEGFFKWEDVEKAIIDLSSQKDINKLTREQFNNLYNRIQAKISEIKDAKEKGK